MKSASGLDLRAETEALRAQYEQELEKGLPSPRLQFELACLLSCSPKKSHIRESTELLSELLEIGFCRSDCLFQLSLAHLKLGEYSLAKRRVEALLRMEPRNLSALSLHSLILDRTSHGEDTNYTPYTFMSNAINTECTFSAAACGKCASTNR